VTVKAPSLADDNRSPRNDVCVTVILSFIAGNFVFLKAKGRAIGDSLNMSLKVVFCLSACHQLLWVNSSKWSAVGHSSG